MAIQIQFTTLVIRKDRLRALGGDTIARVRGRWGPSWSDEHLLAVGFMDDGARDLARELEAMGLVLRDTSSGVRVWRDICVVDAFNGPTNPCFWLHYHPLAQVAWRAGVDPGDLAGPGRSAEAPLHIPAAELLPHLAPLYPIASPPGAEERHEAVLLPLALRVGGELLAQVRDVGALKSLVFRARFPAPGEVYTLGLTLWNIQGATCRGELPKVSPAAMEALVASSNHPGDHRLTGLGLTLSPNCDCEAEFINWLAVPSRADAVAELNRSFAVIPEGQPEAPFHTDPDVAAAPPLRLAPLPWPLYLLLESRAQGDSDHPAEGDATPPPPVNAPPPSPAADAGASPRELEPPRSAPRGEEPPASGSRFVLSLEEGPILREARGLGPFMKQIEVARMRPHLRKSFEPKLTLELGHLGLGDLVFHFRYGLLAGAVCDTIAGASFNALLARRALFARALGGFGPLTDLDGSPLDDMEALRGRVVSAPSGPLGAPAVCVRPSMMTFCKTAWCSGESFWKICRATFQ